MVKVRARIIRFLMVIEFLLHNLIVCQCCWSFLSAGGMFSLYALLCRHAKVSLLPNHQAADEELTTYHDPGYSSRNITSSPFKVFMERHKKTKTGLLLLVLLGAALVFSVGVLTPAISGIFYFTITL